MSSLRPVVTLAVVLLLVGCAGERDAQRDQARRADYAAAAGAPVSSFRFVGPLWSWEALGTDQVVVYARPRQAWLLDVPGCNELPFAQVIGLTSNLDQVGVGFDKVLTGRRDIPCTITRIRPLDIARLKALQQAQRPIRSAPRQNTPAAGSGA